MNFKRCVNYYFFKVVFPLLLITCLNFLGYFLDDDNLAERLANNISLFHRLNLRCIAAYARVWCQAGRRLSGTSAVSHGTMFGEMTQKYMATAHYKGSVVATKNILAKNIRKWF